MKEHPHIAWPLYLTGLLIIVFPLLEFVLTVWPPSPGVLSWRFGTAGLLGRSIMTPMVGLAIVLATATFLGHSGVQRAVMVLGFAGTAVLLLVAGLFALDLVQFRAQVRAGAKTAYDVSSVVTLLKFLAAAVVLLAFGLSGLRSLRHKRAEERRHAGAAPLIGKHKRDETDATRPPAS